MKNGPYCIPKKLSLNAYTDVFRETTGLNCDLSIYNLPDLAVCEKQRLWRVCACAGSPECLLLANAIETKILISSVGSNKSTEHIDRQRMFSIMRRVR